MSSVQRRGRNAQFARLFKTREVADTRGNKQIVVDLSQYLDVTCAVVPQRSNRGEVPGQIETNVVRMILDPDLEGINLWSRVWYRGSWWDVEAPPLYHHGTRHVRHWSMDIRERPGNDDPPPDLPGSGEGEGEGG